MEGGKAVSIVSILLVGLVVVVGLTAAAAVEPVFVEGNATCIDFAPEDVEWQELKVEPVVDGVYGGDALRVAIDVYHSDDGPSFDWMANGGISAVFVKGGKGGNLYKYDPPGPQLSGDFALHAPVNASGKFAELGHVSFCYQIQPPGAPTATPTPTATPLPQPPQAAFNYLPVILHNYVIGEPNDSCEEAHPIPPNVSLHFLPDDKVDWYQFDLTHPGNLVIELSRFVPVAGQLAVYKGICGSTVFLGSDGRFSTTKIVDLGQQTAGHYNVYVSNDGVLSNVDAYVLHVRFE